MPVLHAYQWSRIERWLGSTPKHFCGNRGNHARLGVIFHMTKSEPANSKYSPPYMQIMPMFSLGLCVSSVETHRAVLLLTWPSVMQSLRSGGWSIPMRMWIFQWRHCIATKPNHQFSVKASATGAGCMRVLSRVKIFCLRFAWNLRQSSGHGHMWGKSAFRIFWVFSTLNISTESQRYIVPFLSYSTNSPPPC